MIILYCMLQEWHTLTSIHSVDCHSSIGVADGHAPTQHLCCIKTSVMIDKTVRVTPILNSYLALGHWRWRVMTCHWCMMRDGVRREETSSSLVWMRMTTCHMLDNSLHCLGNKQRDVYNEIVLQGFWWSHTPGTWTHHLVCIHAL